MPQDAAHAYLTVGTVALVAFLAVGVLLWSTGGTLPTFDNNRVGQVVTIPGLPIPPVATVAVGSTITQGVQLTLDATSTAARTATVTLNDPTGRIMTVQRTIALGDTTTYSNYAVTLMRVDATSAGFLMSATSQSCGTRDQQTQLCRGNAACCDGTCQELPSCAGQPDGAVSSCGARQFYCCGGALSLVSCGVNA